MTIEGAIAELQNLINADDVPFYYDGVIKKVIETIIDECKPKVGEWLDNKWLGSKCSVCGWELRYINFGQFNYCPNCGAKMERSE